jgi:Domain of unknown function (DUF4253)
MTSSTVPSDGTLRLGPVQLPKGRQIAGFESEPLLWATVEPVPDAGRAWLGLRRVRDQTGLIPILLAGLSKEEPGRPWDTGELDEPIDPRDVDTLDAATVLATCWSDSLGTPDDAELDPGQARAIAPFSAQFPGLAPASRDTPVTSAEAAELLSLVGDMRIGLVPADRAADALALIGFPGTGTRYGTPAELTCVLRSWEDRFGAVLLEVGFAGIRLLVQRPPRSRPAALALAAEHFAVCDECGGLNAQTEISDVADILLDAPVWTLSWD